MLRKNPDTEFVAESLIEALYEWEHRDQMFSELTKYWSVYEDECEVW